MIDIAEIKNPYVMAAIAILKRQEPPSAVEIKKFDSISDAKRELSIPTTNISKVCKGLFSQAGGFKWKYYNN